MFSRCPGQKEGGCLLSWHKEEENLCKNSKKLFYQSMLSKYGIGFINKIDFSNEGRDKL